jgi:hypothetical protein
MTALLSDDELRQKALALLEEQLGPIEALRFLALVRREPFDYERWREKTFGNLGIAEIFQKMEALDAGVGNPIS